MSFDRISRILCVFSVLAPLCVARAVPGRYILELTGEPVATRIEREAGVRRGFKADLRGALAVATRAKVRREQEHVRSVLASRNVKVLDSVDTVSNALLVELPDSEAEHLKSIPGVARVHQQHYYKRMLDRAVQIQHATDVWAQIGFANAGLGVKVAVLDTGIDSTHPAFQDPSIPPLSGFPQINNERDRQYTNNKIIVARSYVNLLPNRDSDLSVRDRFGHGTATSMIAVGAQNTGPLATITGMAPKAYLGMYKITGTPGLNDDSTDGVSLKAIDDAVSDGMDVINYSFGADLYGPVEEDVVVDAFNRAANRGVISVVSGGNAGPGADTIGSPAISSAVISVGAISNDRIFAGSATVEGIGRFLAVPGYGPAPSTPVVGALVDVAKLDPDNLACRALPANSLRGKIGFVQRQPEVCSTATKLQNLQRAGAAAALLYQPEGEDLFAPFTGTSLASVTVSYPDGIRLGQALGTSAEPSASLDFSLVAQRLDFSTLSSFSSIGPVVNGPIKPDLVAVGANVYTATQSLDRTGDMYDASRYVLIDGTSFSAPMVAGAAALLKGARPGLTAAQYSSLLVNNAAIFMGGTAKPARVNQAGTGLLDVAAAYRGTVSMLPTSLQFGTAGYVTNLSQMLTLTNVGRERETYILSVTPRDTGLPVPELAARSVTLSPGQSQAVRVSFPAALLPSGAYEGFVRVQGSVSGAESRIVYSYTVPGSPKTIQVVYSDVSDTVGTFVTYAILFRVLDENGVALTKDVEPKATAISGGGEAVSVLLRDQIIPGSWMVVVRMGRDPGPNVFRISIGSATADVTIEGVAQP